MVMFKANGESLDEGLSLSVSSTNMNRGYEQIGAKSKMVVTKINHLRILESHNNVIIIHCHCPPPPPPPPQDQKGDIMDSVELRAKH